MDKHGKGAYTLIGEGTLIEGELASPHPIRIDGTFKGKKLSTSEMLIIGTSGHVEANIILAKSAMVGGTVIGNVTIEDRIELEAKSTLMGDLKARDLIINEGAHFQGSCQMEIGKATRV
jgi:cytoskeletal protein CcmA (bactofilin family)